VGFPWPRGIDERNTQTAATLQVRDAKRLLAAAEWHMPRPLAPGGRLAECMSGRGDANQREELRRLMKLAHRPILPRTLRETKYKVAMGGYSVGPNRHAGDDRYCAKCLAARRMRPRGDMPDIFETTEHLFHECPREIWEKVLKWWGDRTGETLARNKELTLLGDRTAPAKDRAGRGRLTSFAHLEEPFALLHSVTLQAIWKERGRFKVSKAPRSPEAVVTDVKRRLQGLANARYAWVQWWEEWHGHEKRKEAGEHSRHPHLVCAPRASMRSAVPY